MPDAILETPWWEQVADQVASRALNQRIAHDAFCLDAIARQSKIIERLALKQQDGTVGQPGDPEGWEAEAMIHVGDITYQLPQVQQPVTSQPSVGTAGAGTDAAPAATIAAESTPLWKQVAAVAAIIVGMGGSAGLASWLTSQATAPAAAQQATSVSSPSYGVEVEKAR